MDLIDVIQKGCALLASIVVAVGFLDFFWGFTNDAFSHMNEEERIPARVHMLRGTFAMMVVFGLWLFVRPLWHWVIGS